MTPSTSQLALREIQRRLALLRSINEQQAKQIIELKAELAVLHAMQIRQNG